MQQQTKQAELNDEQLDGQLSDEILVNQAKTGDKAAFKQLYQRHQGRVYAISFRLSGSHDHADEICQDCFVRLWQKLDQFNGESQFTTWLHKLSVHQAINSMKAKQRFWHRFLPSSDVTQDAELDASVHYEYHRLDKLIMKLPERTRVVFVLSAIEGYQHQEIAEILNIAVGTSKAQYHRAKQMLQEMLS
ncbi:RNA polymerase sigma factor [Shewanella olleyana]|uniref:RNA polymerase sigma factor n=1 Tax=Shewanella olleyana TaxID=135626 RepID=UPI00200E4A34|nr:RNA polymerase sigma factor [Shewanella olleyana]MCL1066717.1 RNA polymerase sigma factor [Shewanella olleyana]